MAHRLTVPALTAPQLASGRSPLWLCGRGRGVTQIITPWCHTIWDIHAKQENNPKLQMVDFYTSINTYLHSENHCFVLFVVGSFSTRKQQEQSQAQVKFLLSCSVRGLNNKFGSILFTNWVHKLCLKSLRWKPDLVEVSRCFLHCLLKYICGFLN